jgi:peptide/nickel transport system ATP-binding protein/glutathione transport system ATP-binding protein
MERVAMLFDRVELPRSFMRLSTLSGGQRQRVAIAHRLLSTQNSSSRTKR